MENDYCYAGDDCRQRTRQHPDPGQREHGSLMCDSCVQAADRALVRLVYDYRDLENTLPRSISHWFDGQPAAGRSYPTPLNESVDELQRTMVALAQHAHRVAAQLDGLSEPPRSCRPGFALQRSIEVVLPRVRLLARDRRGVDNLVGLTMVHQKARVILGLNHRKTRMPGDCSGCMATHLLQDEPRFAGDPLVVYCGSCGRTWSREEYETYVSLGLHLGVSG